MLVFTKTEELRYFRSSPYFIGKILGFVPTMGALHEGHGSLIAKSKEQADLTICSIFVNPTQFNDQGDLERYPRNTEADLDFLARRGCDIVFLPSVNEVYPPDLDTDLRIDFGKLTEVMESKFRPGHFDGVAQVVKRLLDITSPQKLFLGQKDFQQVAVIKHMIDQTGTGVDVWMCETIREEDGLAMSSRNLLLDEENRKRAPEIYSILQSAKGMYNEGETIPAIEAESNSRLKSAGFKPEYFQIVNGFNLLTPRTSSEENYLVACTAAWAGKVRLIDNIVIKAPKGAN